MFNKGLLCADVVEMSTMSRLFGGIQWLLWPACIVLETWMVCGSTVDRDINGFFCHRWLIVTFDICIDRSRECLLVTLSSSSKFSIPLGTLTSNGSRALGDSLMSLQLTLLEQVTEFLVSCSTLPCDEHNIYVCKNNQIIITKQC